MSVREKFRSVGFEFRDAGFDFDDRTEFNERVFAADFDLQTRRSGRFIGNLDQIGLIEAEVWFWRYVNETTYEAGRNDPAYLRVIYERLAENPLQQARSFYEFCGLPWDAGVEARIIRSIHAPSSDRLSRDPGRSKPSRRARLTPEQDRIVERITRDSPLLAWW